MVKIKKPAFSILSIILLVACRLVTPATPPPPVDAALDTEFTLAPAQVAAITDTGLTVKLISVTGDQRCPSKLECAASGPVSISLSVQSSGASPNTISLQTFTDNNGRAPTMEFEGIKSRAIREGYSIQIIGVLPYPQKSTSEIGDADYRVTLKVSKK